MKRLTTYLLAVLLLLGISSGVMADTKIIHSTGASGSGTFTSMTVTDLTSGYIPRAGVGGLLGNSAITDNGAGAIGIGSSTLGAAVTIYGKADVELCAAGGVWAGDFHETGAWSLGANWSIGAGVLSRAAAAVTTASYDCGEAANHTYKVVYTINSISGVAATVTMSIGGVAGTARSTAATFTEYITATGAGNLTFTPIAATVAEIDNVHVYDITAGGTLTTSMPILVQGYGSAAAPAICVGLANTGIYASGSGTFYVSTNGSAAAKFSNLGSALFCNSIAFGTASANGILLVYTAAGSMTIGGTGNGQLIGIKTATIAKTCAVGATVTAASLIPDGAVVVGLTTRITTQLGATSGTTGYTVGDGADADRWGACAVVTTAGYTDNSFWTATTLQAFIAAGDVVLTAVGGNFDGTGVVRITVHYLDSTAATS